MKHNLPTDSQIDAAADKLLAIGLYHGWFSKDGHKTMAEMKFADPIAYSEFGGLVQEMLLAASMASEPSDADKQAWLDLIEEEAETVAARENEASGHCGPYGTDTADDYRDDVLETFSKIGRAYVTARVGQ
jgi:hypothetical protein